MEPQDKKDKNAVEVTPSELKAKKSAELAKTSYLDSFAANQDGFATADTIKAFWPKDMEITCRVLGENGKVMTIALDREAIATAFRPLVRAKVKANADALGIVKSDKKAAGRSKTTVEID